VRTCQHPPSGCVTSKAILQTQKMCARAEKKTGGCENTPQGEKTKGRAEARPLCASGTGGRSEQRQYNADRAGRQIGGVKKLHARRMEGDRLRARGGRGFVRRRHRFLAWRRRLLKRACGAVASTLLAGSLAVAVSPVPLSSDLWRLRLLSHLLARYLRTATASVSGLDCRHLGTLCH